MKYVSSYAGLIMICMSVLSCSTEPEPLNYGTDICTFCKMTLVDNKFGAELVTKKGKVYKFDDLNCFVNYYNSGYEPVEDFQHRLVIDYSNPGKLMNATDGFYVKSPDIRTPMDSQIAAFGTKSSMDTFMKQWNGIYLSWGEVTTHYKE